MRQCFLVLLWLIPSLAPVPCLLAQEDEFLAEESMLEAEDEAFNAQEVLERLAELLREPLDPNQASYAQLQQIPYLSAFQIRGLVALREQKNLESLDDLLQAEGMDPGTLARIRPFLRIRLDRKRRGHLLFYQGGKASRTPSARSEVARRMMIGKFRTYRLEGAQSNK